MSSFATATANATANVTANVNATANATANANVNKKPFCKVCFDAGKPELEYTNHYVKNNTGKVICPILLTQLCRYCSKNGHTISYCPIMAKNKKREMFLLLEKEKSIKKNVKKSTIKNKFQVLDSDSEGEEYDVKEEEDFADDEKEEEVEEKEEKEKKITYASICLNGKAPTATVKAPTSATVKATTCSMSSGINPILINGQRAWADYSSDEDEDE